MATELQLIQQKQAEWDELEGKRREVGWKIERAYESDARQEIVEYWEELLEGIHDDMQELEDWLIDHAAKGWVSS